MDRKSGYVLYHPIPRRTKVLHSKHKGSDSEEGPTTAAWSWKMISPGLMSRTATMYLKIIHLCNIVHFYGHDFKKSLAA